MVDNVAKAVASVMQCTQISKNNGLVTPIHLTKMCHPKRILIHPTSTVHKRTWSRQKFLDVAESLTKGGYEVAFCVSPPERSDWIQFEKKGLLVPKFPSLADLAAYVYESGFLIGNESGTSHLASNLHIPTLIIASCRKQMALWRPGWFTGKVITPPRYIPNFKRSRLRENKWQTFISVKRVIRVFHQMKKRKIKS